MKVIIFFTAFAFFLTGCTDTQTLVGVASGNPTMLLKAYAGVFGTLFLIFLFLSNEGVSESLRKSLLWLGATSLAASPLYWIATDKMQYGIAMGLSGALGVIVGLITATKKGPVTKKINKENES